MSKYGLKNKDFFRYLRDYFKKEIRSEPDENFKLHDWGDCGCIQTEGALSHLCFLPSFGRKQGGNNALHKSKMGSRVKDLNNKGTQKY